MLRLLNDKSSPKSRPGYRIAATLIALSLAFSIATSAGTRGANSKEPHDLHATQAITSELSQSHGALATYAARQVLALEKGAQRTVHAYAVIYEAGASSVEPRVCHLFHLDWIHQLKPGVYSLLADRSPPESLPLA